MRMRKWEGFVGHENVEANINGAIYLKI